MLKRHSLECRYFSSFAVTVLNRSNVLKLFHDSFEKKEKSLLEDDEKKKILTHCLCGISILQIKFQKLATTQSFTVSFTYKINIVFPFPHTMSLFCLQQNPHPPSFFTEIHLLCIFLQSFCYFPLYFFSNIFCKNKLNSLWGYTSCFFFFRLSFYSLKCIYS